MSFPLAIARVAFALLLGASGPALADEPADLSPERPRQVLEAVTTTEVKRFLDPTRMINRVEYRFQGNYLPREIDLYTNRLRPWFALNNHNAVWVRLPHLRLSVPGAETNSGLGDFSLGYAILLHENLERRFTAVAAGFDFTFPTGDAAKGLGLDTYLFSPAVVGVFNPTDTFPIYLTFRLVQSVDSSREFGRDVQTLEVTLQTFHLLPKGFFVAFLPSLFFDLESNFDVLSVGLAAGRALNRRFALQAGYVQHVAGEETFNRGFQIGLNFLWGKDRGLGY